MNIIKSLERLFSLFANFANFNVSKEEIIINCMLKDVHLHAGLGDRSGSFCNKMPESANALIKQASKFKRERNDQILRGGECFDA